MARGIPLLINVIAKGDMKAKPATKSIIAMVSIVAPMVLVMKVMEAVFVRIITMATLVKMHHFLAKTVAHGILQLMNVIV